MYIIHTYNFNSYGNCTNANCMNAEKAKESLGITRKVRYIALVVRLDFFLAPMAYRLCRIFRSFFLCIYDLRVPSTFEGEDNR